MDVFGKKPKRSQLKSINHGGAMLKGVIMTQETAEPVTGCVKLAKKAGRVVRRLETIANTETELQDGQVCHVG